MRACFSLIVLLIGVGQLGAMEPNDPDLPLHEKTLKDAGIGSEPATLLKLFRDRTPTNEMKARLAETVRRLGARSYTVRNKAEQELIKAGRLALPVLKPARADSDIEIARRAERCIDTIEANNESPLLAAAARLLAVRKPPEAVETLLAYLPGANDEYLVEVIHQSLTVCGLKDGKADARLLAALTDRDQSRRLAAVVAIAQANEKQRQVLRPLLADAESKVRLQAAVGLVRIGDRDGADALLKIMSSAELSLAVQAEEMFCQIAGEKAPSVTLTADEAGRKKCVEEWQKWWKANATGIDWKQLSVEPPTLGLTLICEAHLGDGGRVFEVGHDGKARWTIKCNNPIDAQMIPGNRVLIADCHGGRLVELDRDGKEHWVHTCSSPISVQRLPGGNTLFSSHTHITEVKRDGTTVYSFARSGYIYYVRKLKTGMIAVATADGILAEVDTTGKEQLRLNLGGMGNWAGVDVLSGGRYLVAKSGANEVVEVDRTGKVLWSVSVRNPNSATRVKNGHTLVSSHDDKCVYEFDRAGKITWKRSVEGNTFRSRRR